MSDFIQRLKDERKELATKSANLTLFTLSPGFKKVTPIQRSLLHSQLAVMKAYLRILDERLEDLTGNFNHEAPSTSKETKTRSTHWADGQPACVKCSIRPAVTKSKLCAACFTTNA